jgi:hypothetical protein
LSNQSADIVLPDFETTSNTWLFAVWAFCFAEGTILFHQDLIANLVIIIDARAVFVGHVKIGLALPIISNFIPVGYKRDLKEHVASRSCCALRGFKDCEVGVVKKDVHIIGSY